MRLLMVVILLAGCAHQEKVPDPGPEASRAVACHYFNRECER